MTGLRTEPPNTRRRRLWSCETAFWWRSRSRPGSLGPGNSPLAAQVDCGSDGQSSRRSTTATEFTFVESASPEILFS